MTGTGNVTVQGGTPQQQSVVAAAHAAAAAAVTAAQSAAATGGGPFATWFGPAGSGSEAAAAAVLATVAAAFTANDFVYDLGADVPLTAFYDAPVTVQGLDGNTATLVIWNRVWIAPNPGAAQQLVSSGIIHALTETFGGSGVVDPAGVDDPVSAAALAVTDAAGALLAPLNYMYYASSFLAAP